MFVYSNEEECARIMREARKQGLKGPFVGETTLLSQKTIELAGDAANGVHGPCRPHRRRADPGGRRSSRRKFQKRFNYMPDHNGIKGYTARLRGQVRHREEARQVRPQGLRRRRCTA